MSRREARGLIERARASAELGRPEVGLPLAAQAAAMAPTDAWVVTNVAWLQYETERYEEALKSCERAIGLDPEYEWPHRLRGFVLSKLSRHEAAADSLAEAVRVAPSDVLALWKFADFASTVGRIGEARSAAERAVELSPDTWQTWYVLGKTARMGLDWATAERAFRKSREVAPQESATHNNLGTLYSALGRVDDALTCYRRAIEIDPRSDYAYSNAAYCLRRLDRWEEAHDLRLRRRRQELNAAKEAVRKLGTCSAHVRHAQALLAVRRKEDALTDLERAASLASSGFEMARVLGLKAWALLGLGRFDDALALAGVLVTDHVDSAYAIRAAAPVAWMCGDCRLAHRAASIATSTRLGIITEAMCGSEAALCAGEWAVALDCGLQLQKIGRTTYCCENAEVGLAYYKLGESELAARWLRSAANTSPSCGTLEFLRRSELVPLDEMIPPGLMRYVADESPLF